MVKLEVKVPAGPSLFQDLLTKKGLLEVEWQEEAAADKQRKDKLEAERINLQVGWEVGCQSECLLALLLWANPPVCPESWGEGCKGRGQVLQNALPHQEGFCDARKHGHGMYATYLHVEMIQQPPP